MKKSTRTIGLALLALALGGWGAAPVFAGQDRPLNGRQLAEAKAPTGAPATQASEPRTAGWHGVAAGHEAPNFTLTGVDGKEHSLADYKGKTVVLIWADPHCPFIQRHESEKTFTTLSNRYPADKVEFLMINSGASITPDKVKTAEPAGDNGNLVALLDPDTKVAREYGAKTTPHVFVIDGKGKVIYEGALDNDPQGKMKPEQRENYVDAALKATEAGQAPAVTSSKPYGCSVKVRKTDNNPATAPLSPGVKPLSNAPMTNTAPAPQAK